MPTIRRLSELDNILKSKLERAVEQCGKIAEIKLHNMVMDRLYNSYNPIQYDRNHNFLDSITLVPILNKNGITVMLHYDTDKIHASMVKDNWNRHMDVNGNDVSEYIPMWLEFGTEGSLWDREGIYSMIEVEVYMISNYKRILYQELKKQGLNVKL